MNEEEKKAVEKLTNGEKITLTELIRKIKKEGIERFIVTRPEYVYIILNLIEKLQKENELAKQVLIKNSNIADERNELLKENEELKKEIEKQKYINTVINEKGLDKNYEKALEKTMTKFLKNNIANDFISKQTVKDKIEKYKKLSDKFYLKFLESDRYNADIREKGIKCDAIILALEELIEEREENK